MSRFDAVIAPAQASAKKYGIPASVTLAQWALESSYGTHMPQGSNNPFGIKAKSGQAFVQARTLEVINGSSVSTYAKFAKYATLDAAFEAHALVFYNGYYKRALAVKSDPKKFANALAGSYATDPHYGSKLISIMDANNLYQYDSPAPVAPAEQGAPAAQKEKPMEGLLGTVASMIFGAASKASTVATVATAVPNIIEGAFKSVDEAQRGITELEKLAEDIRKGKWDDVPDALKAIFTEFRQIMINFGIDHDGLNVATTKLASTPPVG